MPRQKFAMDNLRLLFILLAADILCGMTAAFLLQNDKTCSPALPCACTSGSIVCENKNLTEVPLLTTKRVTGNLLVSLDNNLLTAVPANAFVFLPSANTTSIQVYLDNNQIRDIHLHAFEGVESILIYLGLSNNNLSYFPVAIKRLRALRTLYLTNNHIHYIESDSFPNKSPLTELYLFRNRLTRISAALNELPNLKELGVSHNHITTVEDFDLQRLYNISAIYLEGNPLIYVSPVAFKPCRKIRNISLKDTRLSRIPVALLELPSLTYVSLSGLPIECSCSSMTYLKSWNVSSLYVDGSCTIGEAIRTYISTLLPKCS